MNSRQLWAKKLAASLDQGPHGRGKVSAVRRKAEVSLPVFRGLALGIDPSVRGTGLAVIDCAAPVFGLVETLTVSVPAKFNFLYCLGRIHEEVTRLLNKYVIGRVGVEETIYVQNFRTMQLLGCARGAALGPIAAAGIPIVEMSPKTVKMLVALNGSATKEAVQRMVSMILHCQPLPLDESDAAAAAIASSYGQKLLKAA